MLKKRTLPEERLGTTESSARPKFKTRSFVKTVPVAEEPKKKTPVKKKPVKKKAKAKPQPKRVGAFTRDQIVQRENVFSEYVREKIEEETSINEKNVEDIIYVNHSVASIKFKDGSKRFLYVGKDWVKRVKYK